MAKTEKSKPKAIQSICKEIRRPQIHGTTGVSRKEGNSDNKNGPQLKFITPIVVKIGAKIPDESTWIAVSRDGHNWFTIIRRKQEKKDFKINYG
jgi:hypothetical protein